MLQPGTQRALCWAGRQAEGPWGKSTYQDWRPLFKLHGDNYIHAPSALEGRWVGRDPAATWRR